MEFVSNIKFLRKRKNFSQEEMAAELKIPRSTLSGYENEVAEPSYDMLIKFSELFNVSTDDILMKRLSKMSELKLRELEDNSDAKGKNLRVLAITVDKDNDKENIEVVPEKAQAGYTTGYSDPQFVGLLSKFQLPFMGKSGTFRTFQIKGDSMPPLKDGYWVTGRYEDDWTQIKNATPCLIITKNDGIVFKLLYNKITEKGEVMLVSTNAIYEPYIVPVSEINEIWTFEHSINTEFEA